MRLGLCCKFLDGPIRFREAAASAIGRLPRSEAESRLSAVCLSNAAALSDAIRYCRRAGFGGFRVSSRLLPLRTHPEAGYDPASLPGGGRIVSSLRECGGLARRLGIRLTLHPDQFVVLSSTRAEVVRNSVLELEHQGEMAEWIGADVINIHGGGGYGDKPSALGRFAESVARLSERVRSRLTVENDDRVYTVADLLPLCRDAGVPLVYDVHHHRCHGDGLTVREATRLAADTWGGREPVVHVSSPREGWGGPGRRRHHDYIDPDDFPREWRGMPATVEVEAKAKERAVARLLGFLG